jgi:hypothetical protein
MEAGHQLIEEVDYIALPELVKRKCRIDFAYIDGWHTFDYVLLDFFYIDKMLNTQGIVAFNDAGYLSVHRVLKFMISHRKYRESTHGSEPLSVPAEGSPEAPTVRDRVGDCREAACPERRMPTRQRWTSTMARNAGRCLTSEWQYTRIFIAPGVLPALGST